MIIYANPICANCRSFIWSDDPEKARDDAGKCHKHAEVNGHRNACSEYDFAPVLPDHRDA